MELVRGDAHVVSEAAVRPGAGQPARHEVDAAVVLGAPAVEAGTAAERGLHQHLVTGARLADAGAQRDDFSAELVAHDEAGRPRVGAVEKAVDVAAADADALDLQQDVARAGTRFGTVGEAHVPRAVEHGGQHGTYNAARHPSATGLDRRSHKPLYCPLRPSVGARRGRSAGGDADVEAARGNATSSVESAQCGRPTIDCLWWYR